MKWEYLRVEHYLPNRVIGVETVADELGAEGWELVAAYHDGEYEVLWFKRPNRDPTQWVVLVDNQGAEAIHEDLRGEPSNTAV